MKKQILSVLLVLCMMLSMVPVSVFATGGTEVAKTGTATSEAVNTETEALWNYNLVEGGVELTAYNGTATDVYVPSFIEVGSEKLSVLKLADGIFKDNDALNSVSLGKGILEIGAEAFYDCDNLVCILISEELATIGDKAFYSCDSFNSVILYDAVENIGTDAFADCPKLTIWCNDNTAGYTYATENGITVEILNPDAQPELVVQDGVTYYVMNGEAYAVDCDVNLTKVCVPSILMGVPVTEIRGAFRDCRYLITVELPSSLRKIGEYSFYNCQKLSNINIPEGVSVIGQCSFMFCFGLESMVIPYGVREISDETFSNAGIKSIQLHDEIIKIGESSFYNCDELEDLVLPDRITEIGKTAFTACDALTEICIPGSVSVIAEGVFSYCEALQKITIEEGVTRIGLRAFCDCPAIVEVKLPESIDVIDPECFLQSDLLRSIVIPKNTSMIYPTSFSPSTVLLIYENTHPHTVAKNFDMLYMLYDGVTMPEIYEVNGVIYCIMDGCAVAVYYVGDSNSVIVPERVKGYPVTELRGTFCECQEITEVILPNGLKSIGERAFYNCKSLTSVNVPDTVTAIGGEAFYACKKLTSINIPDGITIIEPHTFYNTGLESVVVPDSVIEIGFYAFGTCESLSSVVLSKNLSKLRSNAFAYCHKLEEIVLPDSVTYVNSHTFYQCTSLKKVTLGKNTSELDRYVFGDCYKLSEISLPQGLTKIGDFCFDGCYDLRVVNIPNSVSSVQKNSFDLATVLVVSENSYGHTFANNNGFMYHLTDSEKEPEFIKTDALTCFIFKDEAVVVNSNKSLSEIKVPVKIDRYPVTEINGAFRESKNLVKVILPEGLKRIKNSAFEYCTYLADINIPTTVSLIDGYTFYRCNRLKSIVLPEGFREISAYAFYDCGLESINIPESVISIGKSAFQYDNLKSLYIPSGVTSLGESAYQYCSDLEEVIISGKINTIPDFAFRGCSKVEKIVINSDVTLIGEYAFDGCTNLKELVMPSNVRTIKSNAFTKTPALRTIYVSDTAKELHTNGFDPSTIILVHENSYAHRFAENNDYLYFVLHKTENPLISYGTGLSGTVTYTDGSVARGATVEILFDDGTVKESVTADANGKYEFTYAEVGAYTIRATDALGNTSNTQVSVKRMNIFEVFVAGDTNLVLKKGYSVSGSVNEGGAKVTLTDEKGNVIQSVVADENGNFTFENVPNGTYIVTAEGENGSVSQEVTVFNKDVSDLNLTIAPLSATVWGYVEVEDREGNKSKRNWVEVTIYNSEGIAVAQQKTDKDGKYTFDNLPLGEYSVVAETFEMRPDKHHKFDRNHKLTGYAYVSVTEAGEYQADTIVLREVAETLTSFEGKVTANGETQDCKVILRDSDKNEIAYVITGKNGKFSFSNIRDGVYQIIAITKSDGVGYTVITIKDGAVYGDTDIRVYKSDKIKRNEAEFEYDVPICNTREEALEYKDRIAEEKAFYDSLSEKEKKQLSEYYVERLDKLSKWIANVQCETPEGVVLEQGGLVVTDEELKNESEVVFNLNVEAVDSWQANAKGVESKEDYLYHDVHDKAGDREVQQYYEITMSKTVDGEEKVITNVCKDTDSTGKFRITMPIPEEYRGKKHYSMVHVHNGETVILADLDDNPDTITVEVDRFSTFVLTATDDVIASAVKDAELAGASITLGGNIAVNFHFTLSEEVINDENAKVVFTLPNGSKKSVAVSGVTPDENGNYVFTCEVAAKEMTESITAQVITSDDKSEVFTYSVKEYAEYILASDDAKYEDAKPLVKAMLNYGAYAQKYFGYNTLNLANDILEEEDKALAEDVDLSEYSHILTDNDDNVDYYGSKLTLESETAIKHYFKVKNEAEIPVFYVNGNEVKAVKKDNLYEVKIKDIPAQSLGDGYVVTAGELSLDYSVLSYGNLVLKGNNENLKNVIKALYAYNLAAKEYIS